MKQSFFIALFLICIAAVISFTSCYNDNEATLYPTTTTNVCDTTAATFTAVISPIISKNCATPNCHSSAASSGGANYGSYATIQKYIKAKSTTFFADINQTSGADPMPQGADKLAACDINKLLAWYNKGMPNN